MQENPQKYILVVDDEPENLKTIVDIFVESELPFKVIVSPNGKIALNLIEKKKPDIIITDWEMPVMNGIELIKELKNDPSKADIPIIMCTGAMTTSENLETALKAGAYDYIRKPIDRTELVARTNSMLKLSEVKNQLKEKNKELKKKNTAITNAHLKIKESIDYALLIQNSILPNINEILNNVCEHFIYYKPKEIVSGDFYWVKKYEEKIVISVADCTGHGVPGAFMSMLGVSLLNSNVNKENIEEPFIILDKLRTGIKSTFKSDNNNHSIENGLDICFCTIDFSNLKVHYSGAYSPLYIIRSAANFEKEHFNNTRIKCEFYEDQVLIEVLANMQPIGSYLRERPFTNHTIQLYKGDKLYMFSDGFIDQFGGASEKKYMSKNFKNLLLKINQHPCSQQKEILARTYESWSDGIPQVDDILILGIVI